MNVGCYAFIFYNKRKVTQHIKTIDAIPTTDIERFINERELKTGINAFVNAEYLISDHFAVRKIRLKSHSTKLKAKLNDNQQALDYV